MRALAEFNPVAPLAGIIAGLESLPDRDLLKTMCEFVGPERSIFSLDLKAGRPLTRWQEPPAAAEAIAAEAVACGLRRMIVLDLARVGSSAGAGSLELCRGIHGRWPEVQLISGGGVRSIADLQALADAGCQAALVASALYDGKLFC
jgi:phosphoribosylformimino-5-aminoimidazole carboxamide ribotide isomerase